MDERREKSVRRGQRIREKRVSPVSYQAFSFFQDSLVPVWNSSSEGRQSVNDVESWEGLFTSNLKLYVPNLVWHKFVRLIYQ